MSVTLFTRALKEARRDALVSHYLAAHDFSSLPAGSSVTTADDLYEYLLLDTKVSDNVTTSPVSEAISSLQLCIQRALQGYDGDIASDAAGFLAQDGFLYNWDRYNKRYSTWASKEKLRFYTGNYVDPSLRTNKTALFDDFENNIRQGRISSSSVSNAFGIYLGDYYIYANLTHLWAGSGEDKKSLYLTAKFNEQYFWRKVALDNNEKPVTWGEWRKLPPEVKNAVNDKVIVSYSDDGVMCEWDSIEKILDDDRGSESVYFHNSWLNINGDSWVKVKKTTSISYSSTGGSITQLSLNSIAFDSGSIELSGEGKGHISGSLSIDSERNIITLDISELSAPDGFARYNKFDVEKGKYTFEWDGTGSLALIASNTLNVKWSLNITQSDCFSGEGYGKIIDGYVLGLDNKKKFTVSPPDNVHGMFSAHSSNIDNLLNYLLQKKIAAKGIWYYNGQSIGGDAFSGPYGQYLWEIFFHIPYLVATRFATEQRFEEAERWYKYIFNSAGYRDEDGNTLTDEEGKTRYWNCYPLQQDREWDALADVPASTDPDIIATADPMHYQLSIFLHTLDLLIARGDAAYRLLERDTLNEAKMFYVQAQQLLGPRPDIRITSSWNNPPLSEEAGNILPPATLRAETSPVTFAQWLRAGDKTSPGDGNFLPPYNDALLTCYDKLEVRLYNLRHNLSLDGQPLSLPLFATPIDPTEIHRQQSGGDGVQVDVPPAAGSETGWRYPLLADRARNAVNQLTQFGNSLLSALERRDNEKLTLLLQTQQVAVLDQQQEMAQKNLDSLSASLTALNISLASVRIRKKHYTTLINGNLSAQEQAGLDLRTSARGLTLASLVLTTSGGALSALPNTFGLANGGGDYGAPLRAAGIVTQAMATASEQSAVISDISAGYQRRAEEWGLQRDLADKDIEQMNAQIDSLKAQIAMQKKQIALTRTETAYAQAVYDLQSSRFTGQALYNWMTGRLSALYYQLYDATIPVCLQARSALQRELGHDKASGLFHGAVWNDLWQGLLAGEGLCTELQKLDNVWLTHSASGFEAVRTVSLAALRGEESGNLSEVIGQLLNSQQDSHSGNGGMKLVDDLFSAELNLKELNLADDYGATGNGKKFFIKSVAVTLPTLIGPYQDIAATLSGDGETATLSHGMQDTGRFVVNLEDSRFQPFEGMDPTHPDSTLTLSIFNVKKADKAAPNQRAIVENLSDIIFHIRYIMR